MLPIERSVPVSAGDHVDMVLRANPETGHISWSVDIWSVDCRSTTFSGRYSTLVGSLVSGPDLVKIGPDRIPHLGDRGRAELDALRLVNGELSISEISSRFFASHRGMFRSPVDAQRFRPRSDQPRQTVGPGEMTQWFHYHAYGRRCASAVALPELAVAREGGF